MDHAALPVELERQLSEIGEADLLLGVLSYQHARTIAGVVRGLEKAVATHFPAARAVIVHWDAGSTDGTVEAATQAVERLPLWSLSAPAPAAPRHLPPVHGVPGADLAFRAVCLAARATGARGVLLVGADLRTVSDESIARLLRPAWEDAVDLVAPIYARHVLDGPVSACLLYPLMRALYGASIRYPVAAEMSFSHALVARFCEAPGWGTAASRTLPLFLATTAAANGMRLSEAGLPPRDEEPRELRLDLGDLLSEVVGSAFALAEFHEERWRERGVAPAPRRLGEVVLRAGETPAASRARMVAVFRQGLRDLQPIWEHALAGPTLGDLYALGDLTADEFAFSAELWARVVYDFLLAYRFRTLHRDHLLRSLVPLYLGRMAALSREAAGLAAPLQEALVERQARAFELGKADFVDRWR